MEHLEYPLCHYKIIIRNNKCVFYFVALKRGVDPFVLGCGLFHLFNARFELFPFENCSV